MSPRKVEPIAWQFIPGPNIRGSYATLGGRTAEVVECYAGQWALFMYREGCMAKSDPMLPEYLTHAAAKARAVQYLRRRFTPAFWPQFADGPRPDYLHGRRS